MNALQREYGPRGFRLVAVNGNDSETHPGDSFEEMIACGNKPTGICAPAVPRSTFTGVTVLRFELATSTIESFTNAAPVAPELVGNATVETSRRWRRSTTAAPGKTPIGTTANCLRTAMVTGLPAGPSPT